MFFVPVDTSTGASGIPSSITKVYLRILLDYSFGKIRLKHPVQTYGSPDHSSTQKLVRGANVSMLHFRSSNQV